MSLPSFDKILEGQFHNYQISKDRFEDIITWCERLKEILNTKYVKVHDGTIELTMLVHLLGNSFVSAIMLLMKGHVFHSYAVARIGVESFFQLAIIEIDFVNNLKAWRDFNYSQKGDKNWNDYQNTFEKIFRKNRPKYDYSQIIELNEQKEIVERWTMMCEIGSHVNFIQTLFSFNLSKSDDSTLIKSGIFDVANQEKNFIGKYLIWMVDTYFIIAKSISKILEKHEILLSQNTMKITQMWEDWLDFKSKKVKEWGITMPPV